MGTFDCASCVFAAGVSVSRHVKDGAIGVTRLVNGGGAVAGFGAGGGDSDGFGLTFLRTVTVDRGAESQPAAFPSATFSAVTVAGNNDGFGGGFDAAWGTYAATAENQTCGYGGDYSGTKAQTEHHSYSTARAAAARARPASRQAARVSA